MDIRSLACFVGVAEERGFRRAAQRLHITQPGLSQRIRQLEREVGTALFVRDRRSVAPTPAGEAFLEPARAAIAQAARAKAEALRAVRGETGRLRLGFTVIAFYGRLPLVVREFRDAHPGVSIEVTEMNSPALEAALIAGEIDLAVLHPPVQDAGLGTHDFPDEAMQLALPAGHPLASLETIPLARLAGEPLLAAPRAVGPHLYDRLIALFRESGITPRIVQEVTPMTTLAGLVAAGAGLGFVTRGIGSVPRPGVAVRPVAPEPPSVPLAAAWAGSELTPPAKRFLSLATRLMAEP